MELKLFLEFPFVGLSYAYDECASPKSLSNVNVLELKNDGKKVLERGRTIKNVKCMITQRDFVVFLLLLSFYCFPSV